MTVADENAKKKKYIFDSMSPRRQRHILKKGYDNWDPFDEPKDPIDIRKDQSKRTTHMLVNDFLEGIGKDKDKVSPSYRRGVLDMALGLINDDDRILGAYEFSCWYNEMLKREGYKSSD